ncbi:MAG TPA: hypothetical protein VHL11_05515 [Phototrophicaceae bacterium]|jgi:WD40 repeat protein|nr:hypothetical protein [Phototrophicaceae bacterium]
MLLLRLFFRLTLVLFPACLTGIILASVIPLALDDQLTFNTAEGLQLLDTGRSLTVNLVKTPPEIIDFDWSPDGRYLLTLQQVGVFQEVKALDMQTRLWHDLTTLFNIHYFPAWSPDGQHIVFTRTANGGSEIVVGDIFTGTTHFLVENMHVAQPVWSQDGQFIAFYNRKSDRVWQVVVTDTEGNLLHQLPLPDNLAVQPPTPPVWVLNQNQIIVSTSKMGDFAAETGESRTYRIDLPTEAISPVFGGTTLAVNHVHGYSPDGTWILASLPDRVKLTLVNLSDHRNICLFCTDSIVTYYNTPIWSPDSASLAVVGKQAATLPGGPPWKLFIYNMQHDLTTVIPLNDRAIAALSFLTPLRWRPDSH